MTTKNTDLVSNFEATPPVLNNAAELAGVVRTAHGSVELAAGDSTDPGGYFYIAITFDATGGTAGTLNWNINYVVN